MPPKKKTPKKKAPARRPGAKAGNHSLKIWAASLFLLGFLIVSLVFLSQVRRYFQSEPSRPPIAEGRTASTDDIRVELDSFLLHSDIPLASVRPLPSGDGLEVAAPFPSESRLKAFETRLQRLEPGLHLKGGRRQGEVRIVRGEAPVYFVRFQPEISSPAPPAVPESAPSITTPPVVPLPPGARPRVAIIMDDLGRDMATGRALVDLGLPVTFAILPWEPQATRLAEFAHRHGREVMIHLPMEPQSFPVTNPGPNALFLDLTEEEIRNRMRDFLARVPHAVGGNNHMGSRFTEDRAAMRTVLAVLKEADLYFVDSLTTPRSVAVEEARRAGVSSATRDIFLDNVQDVGEISAQIRKLARLALRQGQAVGICHPYPQTLEALRREAPELQRMGIEVVPVSRLLTR